MKESFGAFAPQAAQGLTLRHDHGSQFTSHDFQNVEELRQSLLEFKRIYHENWIIQRHGYKTPTQARREQSQAFPLAA